MLSSLYIENVAVIEKASIDLKNGFNVFTGETGAGKSIVIDAISSIIGGRISKNIIRTGEDRATVVGRFINLPKIVYGIAQKYSLQIQDDEIIVMRQFFRDGKSIAKINGVPITLASLKELGSVLVNIHGQHDNQFLMSKDKHIDVLDDLADLNDTLADYQKHFENLNKIKAELNKIHEEQKTKNEKLNGLEYKVKEIESMELKEGEDVELEKESRLIKNAAKVVENLKEADRLLNGNENEMGALDKTSQAVEYLNKASNYFEEIDESAEKLKGISYELEFISRDIEKKLNEFDFSTAKLNEIESRLNEIFKLKRKYGSTIEDILTELERLKQEIDRIETYDVRLNELMICQNNEEKQVNDLSKLITKKRKQTAQYFEKAVKDELSFLDMKGVNFQVKITPKERCFKGNEEVEFLISANIGEIPKPISKIASGGELSRIMLSIKNVLADKDKIQTLIFDEVDSGVSGSAAQKIGLKLFQVSKKRQVLVVTHIPQIAALADMHFRITKEQKNGRTFTKVNNLSFEERIEEVARIISTDKITDLVRKTAQEMILSGEYIKKKH